MMESVLLDFTDDALKAIVQLAKRRKTGARALRSIVEEKMLPIMFTLPDKKNLKKVIITDKYIKGEEEPAFEYAKPVKSAKTA